jgi:hypothetical protein
LLARLTLSRPSHPAPTFVTIAIRPFSRDGIGKRYKDDLGVKAMPPDATHWHDGQISIMSLVPSPLAGEGK